MPRALLSAFLAARLLTTLDGSPAPVGPADAGLSWTEAYLRSVGSDHADAGAWFGDAGDIQAERKTFAHLQQLAVEYGCPEAAPPLMLNDGSRLEDPDRVARVDCLLTKEATEVFAWRDFADAGTLAPASSASSAWIVTTVLCTLSAVFTAYANNRTARHLGLIP